MFLSRIPLNAARRQTKFLLGSPQAMHAAVLSSFPPDTELQSGRGRVLWRVDAVSPNATWLYIVSPERPELIHLAEQAGWPTQNLGESKDYGGFLDRIDRDQSWAFRLIGNPVHTKTDEQGNSKKLGHVTASQQQRWFLDRAEQSGFAVQRSAADDPDVLVSNRVVRNFRRAGKTVTLATAQFDGVLQVTDADALRHVLTHGLGRAKGYGCGLLTLAPVSS